MYICSSKYKINENNIESIFNGILFDSFADVHFKLLCFLAKIGTNLFGDYHDYLESMQQTVYINGSIISPSPMGLLSQRVVVGRRLN